MVTVTVAEGMLRVRLDGWAALLALRRAIDVPVARIADASIDLSPGRPRGVRMPGTFLPGIITAGSYWRPGFRSFWYVTHRRPAAVIDLAQGGPYDRLVIATANPAATVAEIRTALRNQAG
ncbi:MAG: hypothetical protein IT337_17725 [Thermomicrobiales bacterium]|nr:hypothetical protein [Thermomicrobiales bacterium]